jgi:integrase
MTGHRPTGDGTVYKRKDGRWEGAAYLPTVSGKRKRIRVYGTNRKDAAAKLTMRLADAERGQPVADTSWTVAGYLDYWLQDIAPLTLRPKTLQSYNSVVRLHLKPRLGNYRLAQLSVATLQQILIQQLNEGHSVRTVRNTRTVLSAALTRAMREELLSRNVARLVSLPAGEHKEITPWSAEEASRFLTAARGDRLYVAFLILTLYGLRRGEVLGLRWSDIDWAHNQFHIRQQLQELGTELHIGPVKTAAGKRALPLLAPVRDALRQYEAQSGSAASNRWDLVITSNVGTPLWPRNLVRTFHLLRKKAGLRPTRLHDLRHLAATQLKNLGVPARDAQLILGHAHISTTQQIYQHGDLGAQQIALERIGRALLLPADDSRRSRLNQPSRAESVVINTSIISGTPGRIRTYDPLFRRRVLLGGCESLTSVIKQLRTRTNTYVLGYVAVKSSRQTDSYTRA